MQLNLLSGLSLLVLEDDPLLRRQLMAHLERLGAEATGAGTVEQARRLVQDLGLSLIHI